MSLMKYLHVIHLLNQWQNNRKGYKAVDKKAVDEEEEKCGSPGLRSTGITNIDSKQKKQKPLKRRLSVTESLTSIQEEMKK